MAVSCACVLAVRLFLAPARESIFQSQVPPVRGTTPVANFISAVGRSFFVLNNNLALLSAFVLICSALAFYRWRHRQAWIEAVLAGIGLGQILHLLLS